MRAEQRVPAAAGLASGDAAGFEEFYRSDYPGAVRLAWLLTHSPSVSEDLTQDAFAAVYRRFDHLDHPVRYLRSALINRCKSWHRDELFRRRRLRLREEQCEMSLPDPQLMRARADDDVDRDRFLSTARRPPPGRGCARIDAEPRCAPLPRSR